MQNEGRDISSLAAKLLKILNNDFSKLSTIFLNLYAVCFFYNFFYNLSVQFFKTCTLNGHGLELVNDAGSSVKIKMIKNQKKTLQSVSTLRWG